MGQCPSLGGPSKEDRTMQGLVGEWHAPDYAAMTGTATAVSNRVSRRQAGRWSRAGGAPGPGPAAGLPAASPPPPAPAAGDDMESELAQLKELASSKGTRHPRRGRIRDAEESRILEVADPAARLWPRRWTTHSMVPGGLLVTSIVTRLTSRTSFVIRVDPLDDVVGRWSPSAVHPSLQSGEATTGCP